VCMYMPLLSASTRRLEVCMVGRCVRAGVCEGACARERSDRIRLN